MTHETRNVIAAGSGAVVGTGAGVAGSTALISVAGTTGLSSAGIMSGLATIGSAVGGTAVVGVAILSVGTVALAAGGAYGGYRLVKWWRKPGDGPNTLPAT
ncbi:MAG: hypothetical protein WBD40_03790 [Tepidisphaeraceae bacterium]